MQSALNSSDGKKTKISVVIITFNEAKNIGRCLDSVTDFADEIVVVDSFSTDETPAICRAAGAKFIQRPFEGHIQQKNFALAAAQHDFVLALDADEALSAPLQASVLAVLHHQAVPAPAYTMNRLTNYCGQWIWHSGWYPDRKLRLFDRRLGHWGGQNPHDRVEMKAPTKVTHLSGDLLHYSYYTVEEHWQRAARYADIAAQAMFEKGQRSTLLHRWINPAFKFFRNYFLKAGFLDGYAGWVICRIAAAETQWKYKKLNTLWKAEMSQNNPKKGTKAA